MRFIILLVCLVFVFHLSSFAETAYTPSIQFIKNQNQWDKDILYRADIPGGYVFVKSTSLSYVFYDTKATSRMHPHAEGGQKAKVNFAAPANDLIQAHGIEVKFLHAVNNPLIEAIGKKAEGKNYFLGKDPARWASNVSSYNELIYRNLYPGIDLRLYTQHGSLKYEFIVAPKADARQIQLQYNGASEMYLQDGVLQIKTSVNTMSETKPYTYQPDGDREKEVASRFVLKNNIIQFDFPKGYKLFLQKMRDEKQKPNIQAI